MDRLSRAGLEKGEKWMMPARVKPYVRQKSDFLDAEAIAKR